MEGAFLTIIKGLKHKYRNESGKYFGALITLYNLCFEEPFVFDGWDEAKHPRDIAGRFANKGEERKDMTEEEKISKYETAFNEILLNVSEEVKEKMKSIDIKVGKNNIFPAMNKSEAEDLGVKPLLFRLKETTLNRQDKHHKLNKRKAEIIIATALYNPEFIGGLRENGYINFISSLSPDRNTLALVDLRESPEGYYDIVHYFFLTDKKRIKKERE